MSKPVLEVLSGDLSGRSYLLEEDEFLIGRAPTCQLVIPKRYISREHARIRRDGPDYVVQGLSEKNPVTVGERPKKKHALTDGDEFEVCGIRFRFRAVGGAVPSRHAGVAMKSRSDGSGPSERGGGSWDDEPKAAEKKNPVFDGLPRKKKDEAEQQDSWSDPEESGGEKKADDSWDDPKPKRPGGEVGEETGPPAPRHAKPPRSTTGSAAGPGKVVFGADEDEEPADKTAELPRVAKGGSVAPNKASVKGSTADAKGGKTSGSGKHGESSNERTAELGKVQDPNDPDYDPFAAVEATKKKERASDPQRDKLLKALMGVGLLGIVLAVGIVAKVRQPKEWVDVQASVPIVVTVGGAVKFEEPFAQIDRPAGPTTSFLDGDPDRTYIHKDPVCEIEWLVPHVRTKATFLIRGKEKGDTEFVLEFPESRRRKRFRVSVEGDDPHETARDTRRLALKPQSPTQLRRKADDHLASGETFEKEREVALKEGNYRLALREYSHAVDAAIVLRELLSKQGTVPPADGERVRRCEEAEARARREWEEFCGRELANYRGLLKNTTATKADKVQQLRRVLRAIAHECDPTFMRLRLILEECWQNPFDGDGSERCDEK